MSTGLIWVLNLAGWPVIHFVVGGCTLRMPASFFARDSLLTRERRFEGGGALYRRWFAVQRWKRRLPDGAPWMGGMGKKRLDDRSPAYLNRFVEETRRAEVAHWCMLLCTPVFYLWNPLWAALVMTGYGIGANLPCIVAQRANRIQLRRMLGRPGVAGLCSAVSGDRQPTQR